MDQFKNLISNTLVNISGWSTKQKIIVFESDDWGSIRMPSTAAYNSFLNDGISVNKSFFCKYDNLCSTVDIDSLFTLLNKYKDSQGNPVCITANAVVANPDFDEIKAANFQSYHYETIDKSFERFFPNSNPLVLWKEGSQQHIFIPQFHGREHVNVPFWLDVLQKKDPVFTKALEQGCWGISNDVYNKYPKSIQASFDYNYSTELEFMKESIQDGLAIFEKLFGYRSESFIPNNYVWPSELNSSLQKNGVQFVQGMKYQLLPKPHGTVNREKIRRYNGQVLGEDNGLLQTVRNVQFEPSLVHESKKDRVVKNCLDQIQTAFFWNKPAIVSMHRINFCGTLHQENRNSNLKLFNILLQQILKRWPDVLFMDTVSLGKIIKNQS